MHIPIFKGFSESIIGFEENYLKCQSCKVDTEHEILFISKYFHVYNIPLLPTSKEVHAHCLKCGMRRYNIPLEKQFFSDYENLKKKYRHPWFTYIISGIIISLLLTFVYFEILPAPKN